MKRELFHNKKKKSISSSLKPIQIISNELYIKNNETVNTLPKIKTIKYSITRKINKDLYDFKCENKIYQKI